MKGKYKFIFTFLLVALLFVAFSSGVYALTEDEVQQQVAASSKEAVSGNVFIWFLCAIAFLKISQKIDSFMSSLGISVGHTGGSMLAEAMLLTRGLTSAKGGFGGFGFGRGGSSGSGSAGRGSPDGSGLGGGLAGAVSRHFQNNAIGGATGTGGNFLSNQAFNSSLKKDGAFANGVIGAVAKGNMAQLGSITGDKASAALTSYMGYGKSGFGGVANGGKGSFDTSGSTDAGSADPGGLDAQGTPIPSAQDGVSSSSFPEGTPLEGGNAPAFEPSEAVDYENSASALGTTIGVDSGIADSGSNGMSSDSGTITPETVPAIPKFEDVEIGGGRITGREITPQYPQGRGFALYHADQYTTPQGQYDIVKAVDDSKWYKQYAVNAVEKTPKMGTNGKIEYKEKIVQVMPSVPKRKDKI